MPTNEPKKESEELEEMPGIVIEEDLPSGSSDMTEKAQEELFRTIGVEPTSEEKLVIPEVDAIKEELLNVGDIQIGKGESIKEEDL